jgi:hypothetical protein
MALPPAHTTYSNEYSDDSNMARGGGGVGCGWLGGGGMHDSITSNSARRAKSLAVGLGVAFEQLERLPEDAVRNSTRVRSIGAYIHDPQASQGRARASKRVCVGGGGRRIGARR